MESLYQRLQKFFRKNPLALELLVSLFKKWIGLDSQGVRDGLPNKTFGHSMVVAYVVSNSLTHVMESSLSAGKQKLENTDGLASGELTNIGDLAKYATGKINSFFKSVSTTFGGESKVVDAVAFVREESLVSPDSKVTIGAESLMLMNMSSQGYITGYSMLIL